MPSTGQPQTSKFTPSSFCQLSFLQSLHISSKFSGEHVSNTHLQKNNIFTETEKVRDFIIFTIIFCENCWSDWHNIHQNHDFFSHVWKHFTVRSCCFYCRQKSPTLKSFFLLSTMQNKSESAKKNICQRAPLWASSQSVPAKWPW